MKSVDEGRAAFDAGIDQIVLELVRVGNERQAAFAETQREMWWLVWCWARGALDITNPFPVQMGDPDAAWAREVAANSLRAQGLKVVD